MNFHKRCAYKIPNNCQRTRKKRSKDSSKDSSSVCFSAHGSSIASSMSSSSLNPSQYDNVSSAISGSNYRNAQSVSQYSSNSTQLPPTPSSSSSSGTASSYINNSLISNGSTSPSVSKKNGDVAQVHGRPIAIEHDVHNRIKVFLRSSRKVT